MTIVLAHVLIAAGLFGAGLWAVDRYGPDLLAWLDAEGFTLERPEFAWVLAAIPLLVLLRAWSLSDLPRSQQLLSLVARAGAIACLTVALINPQRVDTEPKTTSVVYVVDVSESVTDAELAAARAAVKASWEVKGSHDVRLITYAERPREVSLPDAVFGADGEPVAFPALERHRSAARPEAPSPPPDAPSPPPEAPSSPPEAPGTSVPAATGAVTAETPGGSTDTQAALRLAFTLLSSDRLARIVLITDGLETVGSLAAERATAQRFGVPIHYRDLQGLPRPGEVMVVSVEAPTSIEQNVPFSVTGVVRSTGVAVAACQVTLDGSTVAERTVTLGAGETTITEEVKVTTTGDHVLALVCTVDDAAQDTFASNNRFEVPIRIPARPRVLYVEGKRSYQKNLVAALSRDFRVEQRGPRGVPRTLGEAKRYDLIMLSDVPREGKRGAQYMTSNQMQVLERYVRGGGGLIVAGGDQSFGPGGYTGSYLERKVLPVKLDVKRKQEEAGVALMLVIDRSGSMSGAKLKLAKQAATGTLKALESHDKLGIIAFDSRPSTLVRLTRASNRYRITEQVATLRPGGGTNVFGAVDKAYQQLRATDAKVKHIILLTDGQSNRAGIVPLVRESVRDKITISTVAVGMGSDQELLKQVAKAGRGRYYFTASPETIPRLFLKETRSISRKALVEDRFRPRVVSRYRGLQMFRGLNMRKAPSLVGYVSTRAKGRAQTIMKSHKGEPILARWRLGLGWSVVWTSDVKNKWSHFWLKWPGYAKFWRQVARDTMRVEREDPSYDMAISVHEGLLTVGVDAVDDEDRFIDGVASQVVVTSPDGRETPVELRQVAAGRYEGELAVTELGPYRAKGSHTPSGSDTAFSSAARTSWGYPQEHLGGAPDLSGVERLAGATGGVRDPDDSRLFDPGDAHTETRRSLWKYAIYPALVLLLIDLLLRRVRFYGRTRVGWREVS